MARKTLADFNYNYQAYADYLESPECANDEGYDTYGDANGNIYESDDWTKGHGHRNTNNNYNRDKDDDKSKGRSWKNPWLKYADKLNLTPEEIQMLDALYNYQQANKNIEVQEVENYSKKR